jgi:hypothetical protein
MTNADDAGFHDIVANTLDMILDHVLALQRRTLALQTIVERAQLATPGEIDALMRALADASTAEIEFAPEYEELRRMRAQVQRVAADQQKKAKESGDDEYPT